VKDIQDEIGTIQHVLKDQSVVLEKATAELRAMKSQVQSSDDVFSSCQQKINNNTRDFEKLAGQADGIYKSVSSLWFIKS